MRKQLKKISAMILSGIITVTSIAPANIMAEEIGATVVEEQPDKSNEDVNVLQNIQTETTQEEPVAQETQNVQEAQNVQGEQTVQEDENVQNVENVQSDMSAANEEQPSEEQKSEERQEKQELIQIQVEAML